MERGCSVHQQSAQTLNVHLCCHISGAVSVYVLVAIMYMVLEIRKRSAEKEEGFFA